MLLIQSDVLQWSQGFKVDVGRGPCDSRNVVSRLKSSNGIRAERPTARKRLYMFGLAACKTLEQRFFWNREATSRCALRAHVVLAACKIIVAIGLCIKILSFQPNTPSSSKFYYSQWLPSGSRAMALTPSYSAALLNTTLRFALSLSTASYGSSPRLMM